MKRVAIQCKDHTSGKTGTFRYDTKKLAETGKLHAEGRVFGSLYDLLDSERGKK